MNGDLVFFYAPWCGYCKRSMPIWDKFTTAYNSYNGIQVLKINCDENPELADLHRIRSFPTIKYLPNGLNEPKEAVVYNEDRSYESLAKFISNVTKQEKFMERLNFGEEMSSSTINTLIIIGVVVLALLI